MEYAEIFSRLTYETAIVVFMKKNGDVRLMLGTRNLSTVNLKYGWRAVELGGHDRRCNINNGNIALFDMLVDGVRSFNIERLVTVQFLGEIRTLEELDAAAEKFAEFKEEYEKTQPSEISMDNLD